MATIGQDVAVGVRRLKATPLFALFSVFTLALSIAAVTTAYAVVRAAAAPPSGVPDVHELLSISHTRFGGPSMVGFSLRDFEDLRRRQTTMGDVVAFAATQQVIVVDGHSRTAVGEVVSGSYFRMLRVPAAIGRTLAPSDDEPGAPPVVVISHSVWQQMFGGRSDAIGKNLVIGGHSFEVVGVAPPEFLGLFGNGRFPAATWVPMSTASLFRALQLDARRDDRDARWLLVRARMRGVPLDRVQAEVTAIGAQLDEEAPLGAGLSRAVQMPYHTSRAWVVRRSEDLLMDERSAALGPPIVLALMAAAGLVLLVSCSNLANLIVARGVVRRHELALRLALGASRTRLILASTVDVVVITAAGGVLGLVLTHIGLQLFSRPIEYSGGVVFFLQPRLDLAVFGAGVAAMAVALLVAGAVPGWILARQSSHVRAISAGSPTVAPRWRARRLLIASQVAVSIVLLSAATLFLGQITAAGRFTGGIDLDRFAVAEVNLSLQNYDAFRAASLTSRVIARLDGHAAVESVAVSAGFPFRRAAPRAMVDAGGRPISTQLIPVTPTFFRTAGIDLLAGDDFERSLAMYGRSVVAIDEGLAQRLFGDTGVLGRQITVSRWPPGNQPALPSSRIVAAVVESVTDGSVARAHTIYEPFGGETDVPLFFLARARRDPAQAAEELRSALLAVEPALGIAAAGPARTILGPDVVPSVVAASASTLLGITGFVVVLAGLYGVLSHLVSLRTREIGMRLALGAAPRQVLMMVIAQGLGPVVGGTVVGTIAAVVVRRWITSSLFLTAPPPADATLMGAMFVAILIAAVVACFVPARRAARIDPAAALKQ